MTGDKLPATNSRAKAYLQYNDPASADTRRKLKRQARREQRRYEAKPDAGKGE